MKGIFFAKRLSAIALCVSAISYSAAANADTLISDDALDAWFKEGKYEQIIDTLEDEKNKSPERYFTYISALMKTDLDDAEEEAEDLLVAYADN